MSFTLRAVLAPIHVSCSICKRHENKRNYQEPSSRVHSAPAPSQTPVICPEHAAPCRGNTCDSLPRVGVCDWTHQAPPESARTSGQAASAAGAADRSVTLRRGDGTGTITPCWRGRSCRAPSGTGACPAPRTPAEGRRLWTTASAAGSPLRKGILGVLVEKQNSFTKHSEILSSA